VKREADVVLVIGSRLGDLDLPYDKYWGDPALQKLIQIDIGPRHFGVSRPLTLGIVSDAEAALRGLLRVLETRLRARDGKSVARHRENDRKWWEKQFRSVEQWTGPGIHPAQVMRTIGNVFGADTIYTADGGNTSLWAHWFLPPTRPRSYHSILELGMLGTGIPSAIGAKLGEPARDVVCVTGDGAAGFHFMEMQCAARERLKITTVVFAEGSWTMEEPNERVLYGRTFGTDMGIIRWDRVGEELGCEGAYVERLDQLEPALKGAKNADGPVVVCVKADGEANLATPQELLMRFIEVYQGPTGSPPS
jgi:acetolactate synthase I/II/III large subunit